MNDKMIVLKTYADLDEFVRIFDGGGSNLLIIVGDPGLGKSRLVKDRLGDDCRLIESHVTAYRLYKELFWHRGETFLIDEVDSFYKEPGLLRLFKCLCNTEVSKLVSYHSDTEEIRKGSLPSEFVTTTRVIVITNDFRTLNKHVGALADRGDVIRFDPTAREVFERVGAWCDDREVLDFFAGYLGEPRRFTMRDVYNAVLKKRAGADWLRIMRLKLGTSVDEEVGLVARLAADPDHRSEEERVSAFTEATGKSRATYFRRKRRLEAGESQIVRLDTNAV